MIVNCKVVVEYGAVLHLTERELQVLSHIFDYDLRDGIHTVDFQREELQLFAFDVRARLQQALTGIKTRKATLIKETS